MPRRTWTKKDERMYKSILRSCKAYGKHKIKVCKRIAAATTNKFRGKRARKRK